jgi:hypothetical protein
MRHDRMIADRRPPEARRRAGICLASGLLLSMSALAASQAGATGLAGSGPDSHFLPSTFADLLLLDGAEASPAVAPIGPSSTGLPVGLLGPSWTAIGRQDRPSALLDVPQRLTPSPRRPAGVAAQAGLDSPIVSGLTWRSGATCGDAAFAAWRKRKVDVVHSFIPHKTWDMMSQQLRERLPTLVRQAPQVSVSLVLFPDTEARQHARCARGEFDSYFRGFGKLLVQGGAGNAVVRIGHEVNAAPRNHPWSISTAAEVPDYKTCFRREAAALRSTAPGIKVEWTSAKRGELPFSVLEVYPGDDVVDHWGINSYDNGPQYKTQAIWDDMYMKRRFGGPVGYGAWVKEAKAHGKKLAVSEWAVWKRDGRTDAETDNPFYITKMWNYFKENAPDIAYETYYNCPDKHRIYPDSLYPNTSSRYQQLWSTGR